MKYPIIRPKPLSPGDMVSIVSPASPFLKENLAVGIEFLTKSGWRPEESKNLRAKNGYLAGRDSQRAEDINLAFKDNRVKGIFSARGGYGSIPLVKHIDMASVIKYPKVFVGFSDITALLMFFLKEAGMMTFSAPMPAGTQIPKMTENDKAHFKNLLTDPSYCGEAPGKGETVFSGLASGPLIGGNLTILVHCAAAGILPDLKGAILLIEDVNEVPFRIDRGLTTLLVSGLIDNIVGVVAGSFIGTKNEDAFDIFHRLFSGRNIPVIFNFPVGHGERNVALPIGAPITLDGNKGYLILEQGAVSL